MQFSRNNAQFLFFVNFEGDCSNKKRQGRNHHWSTNGVPQSHRRHPWKYWSLPVKICGFPMKIWPKEKGCQENEAWDLWWKFGISDENLGSLMKIWDLCWKFGISAENLGSPMKTLCSPMKRVGVYSPIVLQWWWKEEKMEYIMIPIPVTAKKVLGKKFPEKVLKFHTKNVLWKKVLLLKSLRK